MIDFSKLTDLTIPYRAGRMDVVKIESGGTVLWMHRSLMPLSLEVKKITSRTDSTYGNETNIRLSIWIGENSNGVPFKVTYGGLTKEVDGSPNATVFFGTYKGVTDEVETPESGTLTIEGNVGAFQALVPCITGINSWGNNINRIEYGAFQNCSELNISYIPEGVTKIATYAFQNCTAITDIRIPSTVEDIESYAFYGCTNLNTVRMDATTPPEIDNVREFSTHENFQIIVPAGCGDAYRSAWSAYADYIVEASTMSSEAVQLLSGILRSGAYSTNQTANITAFEAELADGMTATASSLLIEILRNGVYSANPSADIDALCAELGVVENEPVEKVVEMNFYDGNGNQISVSGGGLSATDADLLIDILESAVYNANISGKIESLEESLASGGSSGGGGDDTPEEPVVADDITVADGVMTIASVGSEITVSDGAMTIA